MRRTRAMLAGALALLAAAAWAQSEPGPDVDAPDEAQGIRVVPAERELAAILEENRTRAVNDLTLDEIDRVLDLRSIARQQHDFVDRAVARSLVAPGLGHYTSGARGHAVAFAAAAAAVDLTTLVAAYWLLPPAVQSRNLNYLQSSFAVIEDRWKSISPADLVPAVTATITGGLLSLTVRALAARGAEAAALEAIAAGTVRFEPLPLGGVAR